MFPWLQQTKIAITAESALEGDGYELGLAKRASHIPPSALAVVKSAFAQDLAVAQMPYMMPGPVRQEQSQRGLPLPAVAALGLGLGGLHLAGDAPGLSNKLRRTVNQTFGTDLDTETRAEAILKALR